MSEFKKGDELWVFNESVDAFVKVRLLDCGKNYWDCEFVFADDWKNSNNQALRKGHVEIAIMSVPNGLLFHSIQQCALDKLKRDAYHQYMENLRTYHLMAEALKGDKKENE